MVVRGLQVDSYRSFGMQMHNRTATNDGKAYRFGFNGYELDDEVKGGGSSIDFGARIYDPRLGRFLSIDPIVYPYWSPYQYDANCPIWAKDFLGMGDEEDVKEKKEKKKYKDPNGSVFLADDIVIASYVEKDEKVTGIVKTGEQAGEKRTLDFAAGSVREFETDKGVRYKAMWTEKPNGSIQFKGYFDGEGNEYKPEYTYGPVVMNVTIWVQEDKEAGQHVAFMKISGNEKSYWNNKEFTFVLPEQESLDDDISLSRTASFHDKTFTGTLYLKYNSQDVQKLLQDVAIELSSSSVSIGRNNASVNTTMSTIGVKKKSKLLISGINYSYGVGVGVGGVSIGPMGAGLKVGTNSGDTIKPVTFPSREDSLRVEGQ